MIKKLFKVVGNIVRTLLQPSCWLRLGKTNKRWDNLILEALKNPDIQIINNAHVKLNGISIWTENYPYTYGHPYNEGCSGDYTLPSRQTVRELKDAISKHFVEEARKGAKLG